MSQQLIIRIPILPFNMVNAHLIKTDAGCVLVDAGTPGSIAVELDSQDALVGDLIASGILIGGIAFTGRAMRPPFEDAPQTVARELERIVRSGAKRFHTGQGGPLEAAEVLRHARLLSEMTAGPCSSPHCKHASH